MWGVGGHLGGDERVEVVIGFLVEAHLLLEDLNLLEDLEHHLSLLFANRVLTGWIDSHLYQLTIYLAPLALQNPLHHGFELAKVANSEIEGLEVGKDCLHIHRGILL